MHVNIKPGFDTVKMLLINGRPDLAKRLLAKMELFMSPEEKKYVKKEMTKNRIIKL